MSELKVAAALQVLCTSKNESLSFLKRPPLAICFRILIKKRNPAQHSPSGILFAGIRFVRTTGPFSEPATLLLHPYKARSTGRINARTGNAGSNSPFNFCKASSTAVAVCSSVKLKIITDPLGIRLS